MLSASLLAALAVIHPSQVVDAAAVGRGVIAVERWLVTFEDGRTAFAKHAEGRWRGGSRASSVCTAHGANVCIRGGRAIWVDWSEAQIGNPDQDDALLAISITADGGTAPPPTEQQLELVALFAGSRAARAGLPPPEWGPAIRAIERHLLVGGLDLLTAAGLVTSSGLRSTHVA